MADSDVSSFGSQESYAASPHERFEPRLDPLHEIGSYQTHQTHHTTGSGWSVKHSSAPIEEFMLRWEQPNVRNRSYAIRAAGDPIVDQRDIPTRPNSGVTKSLPPGAQPLSPHSTDQMLQRDWQGQTSFKDGKLNQYRHVYRGKPFRPSGGLQGRATFLMASKTNGFGYYTRPAVKQNSPASIVREVDTLRRRLSELTAESHRIAGRTPSRRRFLAAATAAATRREERAAAETRRAATARAQSSSAQRRHARLGGTGRVYIK
jgi:hypothetical protein